MNATIHQLPYLLPIIFSLAGTFLCLIPVLNIDRIVSAVVSGLALAASIYILFQPDYIHSYLYVDGLSKILLITIGLVYFSTTLYSLSYLQHIRNPLFQKRLYYILLNIFAAAMFFSVCMDNIGLIWIGIEATTVSSALLVATENDEVAIESAWRYVIIVSTGLIISLIATTFIYGSASTLSLRTLINHHPANRVFLIGILLGIIGFGTKVGIFPMHTWLPDVHGKAPSPVSAIFSGVLLPVALYAIARLLQIDASSTVRLFSLVLGLLTVFVACLTITTQTNYKRMFAYSSMENMGMILIGLSLGRYGLIGAAVIIVSHGLAKSGVFFLTGDILNHYRTTTIKEVHGLWRQQPATATGLFLGSLAVSGAPPFAIFAGELLIVAELVHRYGWILGFFVLLFLAIAFIAMNYRTGKMIFTGDGGEKSKFFDVATIVPLVNLVLSLLTLLAIPFLEQLLKTLL
jgi:hydrogenase-4 component F